MDYEKCALMDIDIKKNIEAFLKSLEGKKTRLIAVSKTKPVEMIRAAYEAGQRDFGENKVQEMVDKQPQLPADVRWHLIGHLQSNKVKYIAPFVHLVHSVDSEKLLKTIDKEASKAGRVIDCLLQVHIAEEDTKFGLSIDEARQLALGLLPGQLPHVRIVGLMGMATFTDDEQQIKREFGQLKRLFDELGKAANHDRVQMKELSMGMSGDYRLAMEEGSTLVRVGSAIFGERNYA